MSMWMQIGAGLLPAFVILLLYLMIVRKNIISSLCVLLVISGCISLCFFRNSGPSQGRWVARGEDSQEWASASGNRSKDRPQTDAALPSEDIMQMIYSLAANGRPDKASEMLDSIIAQDGYRDTCALAQARIKAASQDFTAARVLYEKSEQVWDDSASMEWEAVKKACAYESVDTVLLAHMNPSSVSGLVPEEGLDKDSISQASEMVNRHMEKAGSQGDTDYSGLSLVLTSTDEVYDAFLQSGQKEDGRIRSLEEDLEHWMQEKPGISSLPQVREAGMKLQILLGNYSAVASGLTEYSDSSEIMIASELYLNGYVKQSDFTGSYAQTDDESLRAVTGQLRALRENKDGPIRTQAEELLAVYKNYQEDAPMYRMEQILLDHTSRQGFTDSSKVYLQAAKMELNQGHEDKSREYIGLAMDTASECDDPEYTGPMYQIMGIIANKDEAERLKDVAAYADNVLNNQLEIALPDVSVSDSSQSQFSGYVTDYVSMQRAAVNITSLDPSHFDRITAYVQIKTPTEYTTEELKHLITVEDCGAQISDYTLEKVDYSSANMLLCCDVSGSMSGTPIDDSRAAVNSLADSMSGDTRLGVAFFNGTVQGITDFTLDAGQIHQAAKQMSAGGGTNIYDTVIQGLDSFPRQGDGVLNTLIVMSDGQDGSRHDLDQIQASIGQAASNNAVLVHCLGLGPDVDANYLQSIAQSTGGTYQYVTNSSSLSAFYENLADQKNYTYKLQYRAEDTMSVDRQLRVSLNASEYRYDIELYTLPGSEDSGNHQDGLTDLVFKDGLSISGLDTRLLFKSAHPADIRLLGTGFQKEDSISVKMVMDNNGTYGLSYDVKAVFSDSGSYCLTVPASVACGTYDVRVTLGGKTLILDNELTVQVQGSEQTTAFGPYVFTSYQKQTLDGCTVLNGSVTLNNWLCFKGQVVLRGDLNRTQVQMEESNGSYIRYYSGRSKGLAEYLRAHNMVLALMPLNTLKLYNDIQHNATSDDYQVDTGIIPVIAFPSTFTMTTPGYSLYPDRMKIDAKAFTAKLPYQDKLLKTDHHSLFNFSVDELGGILTPDNIGIDVDVKMNRDSKEFYPVNMLNMNLNISPAGSFKINTIKNEYELSLYASILFFGDGDIGFTAKWENDLVPKQVMLMIPYSKTVMISGVPVTFNSFELGVDDLDIHDILSTEMVGKMDVLACSVQALVPQMKNYLKEDLSLIKLEDSTLTLRVKNFLIEAETTAKILEKIEIGHAKLQIGNFSYTNQLLGMDGEDVTGISGSVKLGIGFNTDNCTMDISGKGELTLTDRFLGLLGTGDCHFKINWWVLIKEFNESGMSTIGYFVDHDQVGTFTIRFKNTANDGGQNGFNLSVSKNGLYAGSKLVL